MTVESWLPVVGWVDLYGVSDHGRVRSHDRLIVEARRTWLRRGKVLTPGTDGKGRRHVNLCGEGGVRVTRRVHSLVLEAFVGPCPPGMEGCHWDDDSGNNWLWNLRWDTPSSNRYDQVRNGNHPMASREGCPLGHMLVVPNLTACKLELGHRNCLACARARAAKQRADERGALFDFRAVAHRYYEKIMEGVPSGSGDRVLVQG